MDGPTSYAYNMPSFTSPQVVCRPALPSDCTDVLEFTKFIWEGHDYIKYVWDDWLADPAGILAVAEYAGHAVALGKVTRVTDDQWWLEGLRVDPQYQGLKIGSHIFRYLDDWWQQHAGGAIRLMTSWERVQVHHLCDRFGWSKIGEVKAHLADPTSGGHHAFRPVAEAEIDSALQFAAAHMDYAWGLADLSWTSARLEAPVLSDQRRDGRLFWWDGPSRARALFGYWVDDDDGQQFMGVAFVACDLANLTDVLLDVRALAGERNFSEVSWHAPARPEVETALAAAGYASRWPGSAYLFGKPPQA